MPEPVQQVNDADLERGDVEARSQCMLERAPWMDSYSAAAGKWHELLAPYVAPIVSRDMRFLDRTRWLSETRPIQALRPGALGGFLLGLAQELEQQGLESRISDLYVRFFGETRMGFVMFILCLLIALTVVKSRWDLSVMKRDYARQVTATKLLLTAVNDHAERLKIGRLSLVIAAECKCRDAKRYEVHGEIRRQPGEHKERG